MFALLVRAPLDMPPTWFWVCCLLAIALIPLSEWSVRTPQRRRMIVALVIVLCLSTAGIAASLCPGCFDDCCPTYVPYGICWPDWAWGC